MKERLSGSGAVVTKGVKFPLLGAPIHGVGEVLQQGGIVFPAAEGTVELFGVDADDDGAKPIIDKPLRQLPDGEAPEGKDRSDADGGVQPLPIFPDILQIEIPEGDLFNPPLFVTGKHFRHAVLIIPAVPARIQPDDVEGQAEGRRLPPQQFDPNAVHGCSPVIPGGRGKQADDLPFGVPVQDVKGVGAVFASAV